VWGRGISSSFCMWLSSCLSIICWTLFSILSSTEWSWHSYWKSVDHRKYSFISGLSIPFHLSICLPLCQYMLVWLLLHCSKFWNWEVWILLVCSFPRLLWLFWVHCQMLLNVRIGVSISIKKSGEILRGIALRL
jgi:hypothetical protein